MELTGSSAGAGCGIFGTGGWLDAGNGREGPNWGPEGEHARGERGEEPLRNCGGRRGRWDRPERWQLPLVAPAVLQEQWGVEQQSPPRPAELGRAGDSQFGG